MIGSRRRFSGSNDEAVLTTVTISVPVLEDLEQPDSIARRIMFTALRSLMLPPGLAIPNLAKISNGASGINRRSEISGVRPMALNTPSFTPRRRSLGLLSNIRRVAHSIAACLIGRARSTSSTWQMRQNELIVWSGGTGEAATSGEWPCRSATRWIVPSGALVAELCLQRSSIENDVKRRATLRAVGSRHCFWHWSAYMDWLVLRSAAERARLAFAWRWRLPRTGHEIDAVARHRGRVGEDPRTDADAKMFG